MKAILQTGPESITVTDRHVPEIGGDEVLVEVHATGVCGSDAHAYLYEGGYEWVDIPRVMGHEYAGKIVEVGSNVSDYSPGDRIVEDPTHRCGKCFQCQNGQENVCQNFSVKGMHRDGSYAEFTVAQAENIHIVPDTVPLQHAAIVEPLSIATRTVFSQSHLTPGDTALVKGPGPIGLFVAAVANSMGASVLVSGLGQDGEYRLPLVECLGVETVNLSEENLDERADAFTDGIGFDVVFDSTGHHTGSETAVSQVRKGGQLVVVGLPGESSDIEIAQLVRKEVQINTSYGSNWRNFEQALSLLDDGIIDPTQIIDTSFSVNDPEEAFSTFLDSRTCKPVFTFTEE